MVPPRSIISTIISQCRPPRPRFLATGRVAMVVPRTALVNGMVTALLTALAAAATTTMDQISPHHLIYNFHPEVFFSHRIIYHPHRRLRSISSSSNSKRRRRCRLHHTERFPLRHHHRPPRQQRRYLAHPWTSPRSVWMKRIILWCLHRPLSRPTTRRTLRCGNDRHNHRHP